jgi:2,3-bisphosphoglycerate-independent phosphoglycerate mutase
MIRFRHDTLKLSDKITNTDPAYDTISGIGIAKPAATINRFIEKSKALENTESSRTSAKLVNEFSEQVIKLLMDHPTNKKRVNAGQKPINAILVRDAGNKYPKLEPIRKKYGINIACIVDMPVEIGISKVLDMRAFGAGDINDYEQKAMVAAKIMENFDAVYVHIKGPDEFGHDGDAKGKKKNIEDIDRLFFGTLIKMLKVNKPTIIISGDHSTPCINKGHSDDPVPLLLSGNKARRDGSARFTERYASKGSIGMLMGSDVLTTAINIITK